MKTNYADMFHALHPGFFDEGSIRSLPPAYVFEEQILDLRGFSVDDVHIDCPAHITFGCYSGDLEALRSAVGLVDEDWPQYFNEGDRIYCAFDGDEVVSFCNLDAFGEYQRLRIGGPGCVGTIPSHRKQGIGLKMVQNATAILKDEGFDLSYIHYTHVGHWYARLGYKTILRWNSGGIISEEL
ncbi:MAG: GNAT family N-acetyltransferase [Clostridiales bacterium]|nr:GNAT family N-acetyltransferase [Clostridiales bacterium]